MFQLNFPDGEVLKVTPEEIKSSATLSRGETKIPFPKKHYLFVQSFRKAGIPIPDFPGFSPLPEMCREYVGAVVVEIIKLMEWLEDPGLKNLIILLKFVVIQKMFDQFCQGIIFKENQMALIGMHFIPIPYVMSRIQVLTNSVEGYLTEIMEMSIPLSGSMTLETYLEIYDTVPTFEFDENSYALFTEKGYIRTRDYLVDRGVISK